MSRALSVVVRQCCREPLARCEGARRPRFGDGRNVTTANINLLFHACGPPAGNAALKFAASALRKTLVLAVVVMSPFVGWCHCFCRGLSAQAVAWRTCREAKSDSVAPCIDDVRNKLIDSLAEAAASSVLDKASSGHRGPPRTFALASVVCLLRWQTRR